MTPKNTDETAGKGVVIVTGGGRGIGAATCRLAAGQGYTVVVNYLSDRDAACAVIEDINAGGGQGIAVAGDVSVEAEVLSLFDVAMDQGPIVGLVNNAGILETQMPLVEMTPERIDRVFATNVRGTFLCARQAVRAMAISRGGSGGAIVNVSSAAARLGSPNEYVDYAASKGAVDSLTLGLSKEVGHDGIRVNAVRPGLIETGIHARGGDPGRLARLSSSIPLGRAGNSDEVARAIVWLLSDQASYCNGAFLDVTGGR